MIIFIHIINQNIKINNIDIFGHSAGDSNAFDTATKLNDNGYHTSNVTILDGAYSLTQANITEAEAQNLANNGTEVLIVSQYEKSDSNNHINTLINAGIPIKYIHCAATDGTESKNLGHDFYSSHSQIKKELVRNGLIDYLSGTQYSLGTNRDFEYIFSHMIMKIIHG